MSSESIKILTFQEEKSITHANYSSRKVNHSNCCDPCTGRSHLAHINVMVQESSTCTAVLLSPCMKKAVYAWIKWNTHSETRGHVCNRFNWTVEISFPIFSTFRYGHIKCSIEIESIRISLNREKRKRSYLQTYEW